MQSKWLEKSVLVVLSASLWTCSSPQDGDVHHAGTSGGTHAGGTQTAGTHAGGAGGFRGFLESVGGLAGGALVSSPKAVPGGLHAIESGIDGAVGHVAEAVLGPCPGGMVSVQGNYCPDVEHRCLEWLDPPGKYHAFRCARYASPAICRAPRKPMQFCIDRDEQALPGASPKTDPRPSNHVSYLAAKDACAARGARLCTQAEWQFACEGEEMRPYPYGFVRDSNACNIDLTELGRPNGGLKDLRAAVGAHPKCASPFGVLDLAGNLEEWVTRDPGTGGKATLLKGSWWLPGRSTCRATNAGHDEVYQGTETGFRCCR